MILLQAPDGTTLAAWPDRNAVTLSDLLAAVPDIVNDQPRMTFGWKDTLRLTRCDIPASNRPFPWTAWETYRDWQLRGGKNE